MTLLRKPVFTNIILLAIYYNWDEPIFLELLESALITIFGTFQTMGRFTGQLKFTELCRPAELPRVPWDGANRSNPVCMVNTCRSLPGRVALSFSLFPEKSCTMCSYAFAPEAKAAHYMSVHKILKPCHCRAPNHDCDKYYSFPASAIAHEFVSRLDIGSAKTGKWLFNCDGGCSYRTNLRGSLKTAAH
jgi:hypothetical protein